MKPWAGKVLKAVSSRLLNTAVNFDRLCDSLVIGGPVDYTVSGEAGKHEHDNAIAHATAVVLDAIQRDHVEEAHAEDQAVTDARIKFEQANKF